MIELANFYQYIKMDGYAVYIWPSFGLSLILMFILYYLSAKNLKKKRKLLKNLLNQE
tara:strand:- start:547 stop:717 length:171 start_codon:yes stop_codon:yes gene_type:complete